MSKKIDIKRTLGNPSPPLSIEAVEEMTQLIHRKNTTVEKPDTAQKKATAPEQAKPVTAPKKPEPADKSKRGRKPKPRTDTERLLRVSVDLPESVFIQLKILVIQQKTDLKTYIRQLVEKDLAKKG